METLNSSDTSVLTRATRPNIPEDGILYIHRVKTSNLTYVDLPVFYVITNNLSLHGAAVSAHVTQFRVF
jgi:hypothetical protein